MRDPRTQDVIRNQTRFMAKQGIVFEREELAQARIDLRDDLPALPRRHP